MSDPSFIQRAKGAIYLRTSHLALLLLFAAGCAVVRPPAGTPVETPASSEPVQPAIVPHRIWQAEPPVGITAEGTRRNLSEGDTLLFDGLSVYLIAMQAGMGGAPDRAVLRLRKDRLGDVFTVEEGKAFNWRGYHVAVLAVRTGRELGGGQTEVEVAPLAALPLAVGMDTTTGGAATRIRIPHTIRQITLHHSGSAEPLRPTDDPIEKLRALQAWSRTDRLWWDVPYHYLIDLDGRIYEGRDAHYRGETNTGYDVDGHLLISVLGNYNLQEPTPDQLDAIMDLMAWAVAAYDVPTDRIYGHSDLAETSCPGEHLRTYLDDGTLIRGIEARLAAAAVPPPPPAEPPPRRRAW